MVEGRSTHCLSQPDYLPSTRPNATMPINMDQAERGKSMRALGLDDAANHLVLGLGSGLRRNIMRRRIRFQLTHSRVLILGVRFSPDPVVDRRSLL